MTKITKAISIALFLSALFGATSKAQTITANSCSESDVSSAIAKASSGGTVVIPTCTSTAPGGSNTWTQTLTITIPINLIGQGIGNTVLIDDVNKSTCKPASLISMASASTAAWRISGFTIEAEATDTNFCTAHIAVNSGSHAFRIDHITFNDNSFSSAGGAADAILPDGDLWGVIDHVNCNSARQHCVLAHADLWGGGKQGDVSWSQPDTMGTQEAIFMENNTVVQTSPNTGSNPLACEWGARCVFRFNTVSTIGSHGPETANRGVRQMEVYNNTFNATGTSGAVAIDIRSGTGMVFNNTATTASYGSITNLSYYRCDLTSCISVSPWGQCNGATFSGNKGSWDSGEYPCLDGIGRGQGALINRTGCNSNACTAAAWPNEAVDPVYEWSNNNHGNANPGVDPYPSGDNPVQINANKDYYSATASFNGTSGVGVGTLADRPSSCTANPNGGPGVAYWATDQGNWNQSGSGGQGQLFACTASNTWSLYYTPYTYPHPLTHGGPSAPAPPTGLTVSVQ